MNRGTFANKLTRRLKAEVTLHTRRAWQAQMQSEGGNARNNPFNTTLKMPGSTDYNFISPGVAVQNYVSAEQGLEATVKTLKGKDHGYEKILKRLRENASAVLIVTAIGESDWGTDLELVIDVLSDIKRGRKPNTLPELESREIAG